MTMNFRAASPAITAAVRVGDPVPFTLHAVPPNVSATAIERIR